MYINLEDRKVRVEDLISGFIPDFILEENPLFLEFLKSYFKSREAFGSDIDLIRNILEYQKIEKLFSIKESTKLSSDVTVFTNTITVSSTEGWPERYGLLQIGDELITYEYKTDTQFLNCYRGFSGATELGNYTDQQTYTFVQSNAQKHSENEVVKNLSILFLKEFLFYLKSKYLPGFENVDFYEGIDSNLVLASIKDFYSSKGTFNSFEILFRILYGADPIVFLPKEKILKPSDSQYINASEIIVEVKSGNIENIKGSTVFQDSNEQLNAQKSEGVVFDVNFLETIKKPERFFESATSSQSGNVITLNSINHGLKNGDSVYIKFTEIDGGGESDSRVFSQVLVVDNDTFQVFSSESKTVTNQLASINTIIENSNDLYKIKFSRIDGKFYFSGKTLLRKTLLTTDTVAFVDSTLGFPDSGSIEISGDIIQYTSKSINSFKGCSGVDSAKTIGSQVTSNLTVTSYENGDLTKPVVMRVVDSTLNKLTNEEIITKDNTKLSVSSIGFDESDIIIDSFIQNIPVEYEVAQIDLLSNKLTFSSPHNFLSGDRVDIKDFYAVNENGIRNRKYFSEVLITTNVNTPNQIEVSQPISPILDGKKVVVSKSLQFGRSGPDFPNIENEHANVQRVLTDKKGNYYALTSSIPDTIITLNPRSNSTLKTFRTADGSLSFGTDDSLILGANHNYNSGDKVKFTITGTSSTIEQSLYVKKISQNILKLSLSASSVDSEDFVDIDKYRTDVGGGSITVTLIRDEFFGKTTEDQQLIRLIKTDKSSGENYDIDKKLYQPFGVLVNGVDLYPSFTEDEINYGRVESVNVLDGGSGFDVINKPVGIFTDTIAGTGCSVKLSVEGSIQEILVTNKGKNIKNIPNIKILGGNNSDVKISPILVEEFQSKSFSPAKDVSLIDNTIEFTDNHQFETGDKVKYSLVGIGTSIGLASGGSLVSNSEYFIIKVNAKTVKLANTQLESFSGTAIDFGNTFGGGSQKLTSIDSKSILDRVEVISPGKFINHEISFSTIIAEYPPARTYQQLLKGVNVESDYIYYRDHNFSNGDLILYTSESTVIGGLINNNYYYILKLNDDSFRLAHAGSNIESLSRSNFEDNLYVNITSIPTSTGHVFKIPPITFTVEDSNADVVPTIEPIIRGSIKSVTLDSFGQQYGTEVLNLIRSPKLTISKGTGAIIKLVISNGKIETAFVASGGSGYYTTPDLIVDPGNSSGNFAKLFPQIENGVITSVNVISGGSNYNDTASVIVKSSGSNEDFDIQLQKWKVNSIAKNILDANGDFTDSEHYILPGRDNTSQIVSSYAPKVLRSKLGDVENRSDSDIVGQTFPHSKVIGWAFDGNPIYSQFGYKNATSTSEGTKRIKSSYALIPENIITEDPNRPSLTNFSIGYFINDYYYDSQIGDLDEFNGRYCITPEFPGGTYAYFSTLGANGNPAFPYCIFSLREKYSEFNTNFTKSKQSYLSQIQNELVTCTSYYGFGVSIANYPFLKSEISKDLLIVQNQNQSSLKSFLINKSGDNYKVDDTITVENKEPFGKNAKGIVSSIKGVGINSITTTKTVKNGVFFDIKTDFIRTIVGEPHEFVNRDNVRVVVAGVTTSNFTFLNGSYPITVEKSTSVLVESVPNSGITTELKLSDSVGSLNLFVDDIIKIDDEKMKVLKIDNEANNIRVQRNVAGTSIASHTAFSVVDIQPSTFEFQTGIQTTSYTSEYNKVYFNKSVAGIGSTTNTTIDFVGIQTQIKVDFKKLYTPNHKFKTNQKVTYNFDTVNGIGLTISDTSDLSQSRTLSDGDELFIIKYDDNFIGLSSERVLAGAAYTNVSYDPGFYFPVDMSADLYDQSLTYNELPQGDVSELTTKIDTSKVHGLTLNDRVSIEVNPSFTEEYQLFFDSNYNTFKLSPLQVIASGISSSKNTVKIISHGLTTNDRVIYTADTATQLGSDFSNGEQYFVRVFSKDEFSFGKTLNSIKKDEFLDITANSGTYTIEPVFPNIKAIKGSKVKFVGIATLPAKPEFYEKNNKVLGSEFDTSSFIYTNDINGDLDTIEIDTTNLPSEVFFYPKQNGFILGESGASIRISETVYNGEYTVTGISSNTQFNIELLSDPSVLSYGSTNSSPKYTTTSNSASGPINEVKVINRGSSFIFPSGISTIKSTNGSDAIIGYELQKGDEGTNKTIPVNSIYDFTSDKTYSLNLDVPSIVSVRSNNKIVGINITDSGSGYVSPPKVKILGQPDIYSVTNLSGNSVGSVNLISKDNGILSDSATVFADFHTNGVEVTRVTVEADNTSINLFLKEPNNGFNVFPFALNDEIYIDGVAATEDSGTGFNSSDYNFEFFKITGITTTQGSARIRYSIAGVAQTAGTFDSVKSYGRVIKKSDLAKFEAILETSEYTSGEIVTSNNGFSAKIIENGWDSENKILSLVNRVGTLDSGDILTGSESGAKSIVNFVSNYDSEISRNSTSTKSIDIVDGKGLLNDENQVLPDNFYHQSFAYDIISEVSLDKWDSTVSNINHISGFERFGTFVTNQEVGVAVTASEGSAESTILILDEDANLNTAYQFDLASENTRDVGSFSVSNEITFNSRKITDSIEALTNRAILIDDISEEFTGEYDPDNGGKFVGVTSFRLKTSQSGISTSLFVKHFNSAETAVVNISDDRLTIPAHNFSTGELLEYSAEGGTLISIGSTDKTLAGVTTTKLPSQVFAIRIDDDNIKLAGLSTDAKNNRPFDITVVGSGVQKLTSTTQNTRCMLLIDGIIQTPLTTSDISASIAGFVTSSTETSIPLVGITSINTNSLIQIEDEIIRVDVVGSNTVQNLLTYSERLDEWSIFHSGEVIPNAIDAPDGTRTADKIDLSAGGNAQVVRSFVGSPNTTYTVSFYGRSVTGTEVITLYRNPSNGGSNTFTLTTEWKRFTNTYTTNASSPYYNVLFLHNGTAGNTDEYYIWGVQVEESSTASRYIQSIESFVSRASSATYVDDATGFIKTTPVNLKTNSEEVDTFPNSQVTVTANQFAAPNGTITADRVDITNANNIHQVNVGKIVSGAVSSTTSVYVKGISNVTQVQLRSSISGGRASAVYDLVNVTSQAFNASNVIFADSSITPAGNGWYRISLTFTTNGASAAAVFLCFTDGNADPDVDRNGQQFVGTNESMAVWGAQVEEGLVMNDYIKTTSTISGAARYEDGKLILEGASTNFTPNSDSAQGSNLATTLVATTENIVSPRGIVETVRKLTKGGGLSVYRIGSASAGAPDAVYAISFWVKMVSTGTPGFHIDINDKVPTSYPEFSPSETTTEWKRFVAIGGFRNDGGSAGHRFFDINLTSSNNVPLYIWGAQIEQAEFASSYIPTTSSAVTRAADVSTSTTGSASIVTAERGVLGSVAGAHAVGSATTVREGQYIIRDDVVFFDSAPLSGVNTIFNFEQTGIPTSFSRQRFHGRVFNRLSYENNKIFDDISQQFNGTANNFELLANGESTEDIFSSNAGILTGTDVSSGIVLINNIFQVPSVDYDLVENVGVGASIEFSGTSSGEDLPSGGKITEFTVERGGGYQPLTRASAFINVSGGQLIGGSIQGLTLLESGSGYREDMPVTINSSNPGTGATIFALVGTGSNVGFITGFRIDNGGSNYTSGDTLEVIIPSPQSYSQLPLQGGSGSGAVGDLVIVGAGGTTFTFELTDGGVGYRENDVLTITGIPTSPDYDGTFTDFSLTVDNTSRDKFSSFTFGEMLLFDDISDQANDARVAFSLTRTIGGTKSLVSLDAADGSNFDIQNNLLVFINDILQIPEKAYTFTGGTKITFTEPPKKNSKISILYFKGSDEDILEIDVLETVKKGDLLRLDKYDPLNLDQQNPRRVFDILSSDVAETNDYSNVGLGTNPNILRSINWTKQSEDLIINADIVYKTRPELVAKPIPNTNIIKAITSTDSEIFVDTVKNFEIDSLVETDNDLLIIDNSLENYVGASATITVSDKIIQSVSVSAAGSGYYDAPNVNIFSPVPQEKISGIEWTGSNNVGVITYSTSTTIGNNPLGAESATIGSGVTVTVNDTFTIAGLDFANREFNSIEYSTSDDRFIVVGDGGAIGYSTANATINHLIQPAGQELFTEKLNGVSVGSKSYGSVYYVVGNGVIGFSSSIQGIYSKTTTAFPPVTGGITGSSKLNPNTKVSISGINLNDVQYFDSISKAVAVGSTIMVNSYDDPGEDWQMVNITSGLGGPGGKILNKVHYYNRQDAPISAPVSAGYVAIGNTNYIFKSHNGTKWNEDGTSLSFTVPNSSLPSQAISKNFFGVASNENEIVVVGSQGLIIRATSLKSNNDQWSYVGITTTEDFIDVIRTSNSFVAISTTGKTFTSTQGITWTEQSSELYGIGKTINDAIYVDSLDSVAAIGSSSGTTALIAESENSTVSATFTATVSNGSVTNITINNPGYGYSTTDLPIIQVSPPIAKYEDIENVKVEGDYGIVVSISTVTGVGTDIGLQFELKTDPLLNSSLYDAFTITSSGIDTGYYFAITDSVYASTEEFAGVDASNNVITLSTEINNIYRASSVVTDATAGVTTVVADINLTTFTNLNSVINAVGTAYTEYSHVARYSWGRIYDFDRPNAKSFSIKTGIGTDHNNVGLSSNPVVIRKKQIKENY